MQAYVARKSAQWRREAIKFTDRRVRMMSEILSCIKLIKMYSWEVAFSQQINTIRVKERKILQRAAYLQVCWRFPDLLSLVLSMEKK